ncbi:hypothetical protein B0H14DRAFT_2566100 [Mycena olivaceomarginata]|nr:hypothetical protein B0H14DRAFT_2566100 [Mycena olivaceomarginata]
MWLTYLSSKAILAGSRDDQSTDDAQRVPLNGQEGSAEDKVDTINPGRKDRCGYTVLPSFRSERLHMRSVRSGRLDLSVEWREQLAGMARVVKRSEMRRDMQRDMCRVRKWGEEAGKENKSFEGNELGERGRITECSSMHMTTYDPFHSPFAREGIDPDATNRCRSQGLLLSLLLLRILKQEKSAIDAGPRGRGEDDMRNDEGAACAVIVLIAQITRETGLRQTCRGDESWEWECHARRRRRQALLLCISFLSMPAVKTPDRSFPSIYMSEYTYVVRNSDKIHARMVTVSMRRTIFLSSGARDDEDKQEIESFAFASWGAQSDALGRVDQSRARG